MKTSKRKVQSSGRFSAPMILYGSQTSPFVRPLRLLLPESVYTFKTVNIFSPEERESFRRISPLLKVPVLEWEGVPVWDSRIIFSLLCKRGFHQSLDLEQENLLTAIVGVLDSAVQKLLCRRSNFDWPLGSPIEMSHSERIQNTLNYLETQIQDGYFVNWNYVSMSLYSLIDWLDFRQLQSLEPYPGLLAFRAQNEGQPRICITDPQSEHLNLKK